MERFCHGDQAAFAGLFARLGPVVQSFLYPMVRNPALAEDLTQVTFTSLIRSRDRYQRGAPLKPWLLTIAANAARDSLRRVKRSPEELTLTGEAPAGPAVDSAPGDAGLRKELEAALAKLPGAQREAVVLHQVQGLPFEEVARVLGITPGAARIRAHRGYERLRALLAHLEQG